MDVLLLTAVFFLTLFAIGVWDLLKDRKKNPILIIHSASADASADKSAGRYSEMSATLGVLSNIWPQ